MRRNPSVLWPILPDWYTSRIQSRPLVSDVDAILECTPTELDHSRALEASIVFIEQLDKLINSATARGNDALEQLELYQVGLGQRLRQRSDEIIEGAFDEAEGSTKQIESPPLVPNNEPTTSVVSTDTTPTAADPTSGREST